MSKTMKMLLPSLFVTVLLAGYSFADDPLALYARGRAFTSRSLASTSGANTFTGSQTFPDGIIVSIQDGGNANKTTGTTQMSGNLMFSPAGTYDIGGGSFGTLDPNRIFTREITFSTARNQNNQVMIFSAAGAGIGLQIRGDETNGATAIGVTIDNRTSLTTAGSKICSFQNAAAEKAYISQSGDFYGASVTVDAGVTIGIGGTVLTYSCKGNADHDLPVIGFGGAAIPTCARTKNITCTGAAFSDTCTAGVDQVATNGLGSSVSLNPWVTAPNTVVVDVCYVTSDAGTFNQPDSNYTVRCFR